MKGNEFNKSYLSLLVLTRQFLRPVVVTHRAFSLGLNISLQS